MLFSIRYSNSWVRIVLFVFGIRSIFKNELFGIRYSLNFQKWIYSVFGPYSLFFATLGRSVLICFPKYNGDAMQCINHLRRHNMLYFSLELFKICSYPSRLAFNSTKANLAFSLMYLFYPLATFANHFFISFFPDIS